MIRPRRSVLFTPGSGARALDKAKTLPADALILDLEDAVAPDAKDRARDAVVAAVRSGFGKREVVVRINALGSAWGEPDVLAMAAAHPDAVLIPKVQNPNDVLKVSDRLPKTIAVWAMIETPAGVLDVSEIAAAGDRLSCLVIGSNDLIKEMGGTHTPDRTNIAAALTFTVLAARRYGLGVIDGVHNDIADSAGFAAVCAQGRAFGFDGKTLIHPSQIGPCNAAFAPRAEEVVAARRIIAAFDLPENADKGAILFDGCMVERLHTNSARRLVALAEAIAAR